MERYFFPSFVGYKRRYLRSDFYAALIVTAIAVPESLAFAAIIGLPVQTGLYCAVIAPLIFAALTTSRRLVIGADSATAALLAGGAGAIAAVGTSEYYGAVTALSLLGGILVVLLGVARFGFLADLISRPVLVGFVGGVGIQLLLGKLPEMLGLEVHGTIVQKIGYVITHISAVNLPTILVSAAVLVAIFIAPKLKLPGALAGIVVALGMASFANLESAGVRTIGSITEGLPNIVIPTWSLDLLFVAFPTAITIALVILAQSTAVTRSFAARHDEETDDNRDLIALGFANIASVFSQGFSVNGSPPRSFAAEMNGGRSQMVNVFMSGFIILILLFAAGILEEIPVAALAVIIGAVGFHLVNWSQLKDIYRTNRTEFMIAIVALLGVVLLGVRQGIFIAIIASLMERLRREYRPVDHVLISDRKIDPWARDRIDPHHRYRSAPEGLLVYRFDSALFFENSGYFSRQLMHAVNNTKNPVHTVIIDAGSISDIDFTGAEELRRCYKQLRADETSFGLAHVSPNLKKLLDRYELTKLIGKEHIYPTLNAAIKAHPTSKRSVTDMVKRLDLPKGSFVVIGGGVLEVLKIRDTHDVDIVVNDASFRNIQQRGWTEYVQDDGKRVLSRNGYKVMKRWVHMDFKRVKKHAFTVDGVAFMDVRDLMDAKQKLGRKKDLRDVQLIREYLSTRD